MIDNKSKAREVFVDGIAHPKEKVLAEEILQGKKVGEFSLDFDQIQVDAMTSRLEGAGCFDEPTPDEPKSDDEQDEPDDGGENGGEVGNDEEPNDEEPTDPVNPDEGGSVQTPKEQV